MMTLGRFSVQIAVTGIALGLAPVHPVSAQLTAGDDEILVAPRQPTILILEDTLLGNDEVGSPPLQVDVFEYTTPHHGSLTATQDGFEYVPDASFWVLGTDSFTYTLTAVGAEPATATVLLLAQHHGTELVARADFEEGSGFGDFTPLGTPEITTAAALSGDLGLESDKSGEGVQRSADGGDISGTVDCEVDCPDPLPPTSGGPEPFAPRLTEIHEMLRLRIGAGNEQKPYEMIAEVWDENLGDWIPSQPVPVAAGVHRVRLDWWKDDGAGIPGGALLRVSGLGASRSPSVANGNTQVTQLTIGHLEGGTAEVVDVDNIRFYTDDGYGAQKVYEQALVDGFEAGGLGTWNNAATTSAQVTGAAALTGRWGLEVDAGGAEPYLRDPTPGGGDHYATRLRFDPSSLTMAEGDAFLLFAGTGDTGIDPLAADLHLQLWVRLSGGQYELQAQFKKVCRHLTDWVPISAAPHTVELTWLVSTHPDKDGGGLGLWIDGVQRGELFPLPSFGFGVETVYLGALGVDAGTSGTFYVDNFESWE